MMLTARCLLYKVPMQVQRPCFRPDLIAKPVLVAKVRLFELRDSGTGRVLRFTENGYSIAYLLNGQRTLAEVRVEFFAQRGIHISDDKLRRLLKQLELLGCLVGDPNLTVPYNALKTAVLSMRGDGGIDEALTTVVLGDETLRDYYSVLPDVGMINTTTKPMTKHARKCQVPSSSRALPMSTVGSAKRKVPAVSTPVSVKPAMSSVVEPQWASAPAHENALPSLPPLPAWPPLANAMRRAREEQPAQSLAARSSSHLADVVRRYPRAATVRGDSRTLSSGPQALWLAGSFFAAALVWASWSLARFL